MKSKATVPEQSVQAAPLLTDFAEQGAVYDGLMKTLHDGTMVHAYLISGAEGIGKRTLAGLIAQVLLCTGNDKPCGACPACVQVREGNHPDVILVRPEKNAIRVDEIREVIRKASEYAFSGGQRVILIEHAEKMNPNAQNSLLKTLEEPIEGTTFLLTTDAPALLLPTIISRVRQLKLHPWPDQYIQKILTSHGIDDMRAMEATQVSGGSIGRAMAVAADEAYWQRRREVMQDFFAISSRSDILRISNAWKDRKESAGELLADLDDMLRLLLLVRLGQADRDTIRQYPDAWQRLAVEGELSAFVSLQEAVRDARRLKTNQVTWQAVIERLLLRLMEESSKWST